MIADAIAQVRDRIRAAAQRAGRDPETVTLVAVTKTQPPEAVWAALDAGLTDVGENRIEEAAPKMQAVAHPTARWHMLGHIQSRKAEAVSAARFTFIHSIDSLKLAERFSRLAVAGRYRQPVLLECNVSGEASKSGFALADPARWADWWPTAAQLVALPGLQVQGLMTIAPVVAHPDDARPYFARLRQLRDQAQSAIGTVWPDLSMGMTDDFEAAILEGATVVRVGRAIFGERA